MTFRREIWTYLIVTAVTVLIWFWAAGETRDSRPQGTRIQFTVADPESWVITPRQQSVTLSLEGSQLALQRAEERLRQPIEIELTPAAGANTVDLLSRLREDPVVDATGVKILSAEPSTIEVRMDEIVHVEARIRPTLPRVQTTGDVDVEPEVVTIAMTRTMRQQLPGELFVEPQTEAGRLAQLEPDVRHTISLPLRLADALFAGREVTIDPPTAKFSFVVRSRITEHTLDSVRVQVAGPPEDSLEYIIDVEPTVLRNVTVRADAELISRIAAEDVTVVAMVHLSSREKEQAIDGKAVSYFLALVPDNDSRTYGQIIEAEVEDSPETPFIELKIQRTDAP